MTDAVILHQKLIGDAKYQIKPVWQNCDFCLERENTLPGIAVDDDEAEKKKSSVNLSLRANNNIPLFLSSNP